MERYMNELVEGFWEMSDRPKVALTLKYTSREKRVVKTLETDDVEAKICVTTRAAVKFFYRIHCLSLGNILQLMVLYVATLGNTVVCPAHVHSKGLILIYTYSF